MKRFSGLFTAVAGQLSAAMVLVGCAAAQSSSVMPSDVAPVGLGATPATKSEAPGLPTAPPPADTKTTATKCDLVCGGAHVVSHKITPDESADYYTQEAVKHADEILNAMHDDLLSCYTTRLRGSPKAHGFITVDIVIGPAGEVQEVETLGGALLGDAAMACIVNRIKRGRFDPPHGGGTMRIEAPFTLRNLAPGEVI